MGSSVVLICPQGGEESRPGQSRFARTVRQRDKVCQRCGQPKSRCAAPGRALNGLVQGSSAVERRLGPRLTTAVFPMSVKENPDQNTYGNYGHAVRERTLSKVGAFDHDPFGFFNSLNGR